MVDANTLSGTIGSPSLSTPGTVQLQVQNTQTMQSSQAVPVVIAPQNTGTPSPLTISLTPLPQGVVGSAYTGTLAATGGTSPYTWSITTGQLPAGLSLAASTGIISGTPTASGSYSLGVTVVDSEGSPQSASTTVTLAVVAGQAASAPTPLSISTSSLPSGTIGSAYSTSLVASGGTAPYTWSFVSGNIPAGLSLNTSTGLISGTPTTTGTATFTAAVADSESPAQTKSVTLSIVIAPVSLAITTSSVSSGVIGSAYSSLLQVSGGTAPYTWSITAGSLPAGLSLGTTTGIISGTPTAIGTANFTATVADAENPAQTKSAAFSLVIAPATLTITSSTLPSGTQSASYSQSVQATGGTAPYTWSISSGALPAGLSLAPATGLISGTPTASGNFSIGVTVKDAGSPAQTTTATVTLSVVAAGTPLTISSTSLPGGIPNQTYKATLSADGGTAPYTWSVTSGTLPSGLSLAKATGVISGTPTASSTTSLTFKAADSSSPAQTKTVTLSLVIAPVPLAITTTAVPSGTQGSTYSALVNASGGTTPYAWSISSGSLSAGLTLGTTTGLISGTPTATGTSSFTVTITDAGSPAQTQSVKLSLVIAAPAPTTLTISTSSLPSGTKGASYSNALQASGGTTPYAWSITTGSLPAGLALTPATGLISGAPTATGTTSFTATVTDAGSPAQTKSVNLSIVVAAAAPPALTITATLPSGTAGTAYSNPMTATGGTPAYTWSITTGTLPAGLTLAATTGIISGTPSASGTYNFTATVTDSGSPALTQSAATSIGVAAAQTASGPGNTWYVRPDGGLRYSSNVTTGQCDGLGDAPYPGTGTNQHCAFNDVRMLWQDGSYTDGTSFPGWGWVIAGGDTVIIRGTIAEGVSYRVGWNDPSTYCGSTGCWGIVGTPNASAPAPPAGTAGQHTKIYGECMLAGTCNSGNSTIISNLTQLHGGYSAGAVLTLSSTQYVDVVGLDITDFAQCVRVGTPAYPSACSTSYPLDDFANQGVTTNNTSANLLLQDINIHGLTENGLWGPIGGPITMTRVRAAYNGSAGWEFDDGNATPDAPGSIINATDVTMEWNGCNEEYPMVDTYPAISCYDSVSGGFGDAWSAQGTGAGGQTSQLQSFTCLRCIVRYNTKDGFGMNHVLFNNLTITDSQAYSNMGQQWKWSAYDNSTVTFVNNLTMGDCNRQSAPITGAPSTFNTYLSNFCRAGGDNLAVGVGNNGTTLIAFNTIAGYAATTFDFSCSSPTGNCPSTTLTLENNILLGYSNPAYNNGTLPGAYYINSGAEVPVRSNNLYFNQRNTGCPATGFPGEICADPLLVGEPASPISSESALDNFQFLLTSGSPAIGAGVAVPSLTLDYNGVTRPNPPTIGPYEP